MKLFPVRSKNLPKEGLSKKEFAGNFKYFQPLCLKQQYKDILGKVGKNVKDVKVGDHVGVGYFVDACLTCNACKDDEENMCEAGNTTTVNGVIKHGRIATGNGKYTYGGFSDKITVNRKFIIKIAKSYPLKLAGPIFCRYCNK